MTAPHSASDAPQSGGTTSQFETSSTEQLEMALRRLVLDYASPSGRTARDFLGERLYLVRAPDKVLFPYATMRLRTRNDGKYHGLRLTGDLEVQVYGRPYAQRSAVLAVGDLVDQCFLTQVMRKQGLVFAQTFDRQELPLGGAPIDGEVVTLRLSYTLVIWPQYLIAAVKPVAPS